jgi:hypothetical protein
LVSSVAVRLESDGFQLLTNLAEGFEEVFSGRLEGIAVKYQNNATVIALVVNANGCELR